MGDYLGIDLRAGHQGEIVYLSHDDGSGHGHVLGADLIDFLRRGTPPGCPGPEDLPWRACPSKGTSMVDPDGGCAGVAAYLAWCKSAGPRKRGPAANSRCARALYRGDYGISEKQAVVTVPFYRGAMNGWWCFAYRGNTLREWH